MSNKSNADLHQWLNISQLRAVQELRNLISSNSSTEDFVPPDFYGLYSHFFPKSQGWAIPGFGQLYYTNTILEETITILYKTYTNSIPIFLEGLFMHTFILNGTKPCIIEMEIKNVPFKTQPELMFKRYADLNNIHDFTCLILWSVT